MTATGSPLEFYYKQNDAEAIHAQAGHIEFNSEKGQVVLKEAVQFNLASDTVKAEKILYNIKTDVWEIPKIENKRIEIIKRKSP